MKTTASLRTRLLRATAVLTVTGVGFGIAAAPAGASAPKATYTKAACNKAIDQRLWILGVSEARISQVKRLTDEQKAAQIAGIDAVEANLTNVNRPAVAAAVGRTAIRAACQAIYTDNRVYAVVLPQLFLSVRIDEFGNAFERFNPMVAEKKAAGADTTEIEALMADAAAHVDAAAQLTSSVSPATFNADPALVRATFDEAQAHLQTALVDVFGALAKYRDLAPTP